MVAIKTGAAPIWVFCVPVESGDPGSQPEVEPVRGQVMDPKTRVTRSWGLACFGVADRRPHWRRPGQRPSGSAAGDRGRGGQESDQLGGDLPGDVAGQPVADDRNQHEASVRDAGGRGAHVAGLGRAVVVTGQQQHRAADDAKLPGEVRARSTPPRGAGRPAR